LAHVLVGKYCDHLPLYRQSEIYARDKVDLHRSTLTDWGEGRPEDDPADRFSPERAKPRGAINGAAGTSGRPYRQAGSGGASPVRPLSCM
jgi:hypothetical protein